MKTNEQIPGYAWALANAADALRCACPENRAITAEQAVQAAHYGRYDWAETLEKADAQGVRNIVLAAATRLNGHPAQTMGPHGPIRRVPAGTLNGLPWEAYDASGQGLPCPDAQAECLFDECGQPKFDESGQRKTGWRK